MSLITKFHTNIYIEVLVYTYNDRHRHHFDTYFSFTHNAQISNKFGYELQLLVIDCFIYRNLYDLKNTSETYESI